MIDPRAIEAGAEALERRWPSLIPTMEAANLVLAAADGAVPQVPVEVAERLAGALEGMLGYSGLEGDGGYAAAERALADYRAVKAER